MAVFSKTANCLLIMNYNKAYKIILFDGVCNLCNSAVNFVIRHDKKNVFKFAALQSEIGQELISKFNIDTEKVDSIILIEGEKYYEKSSAALRISKDLSGAYPLLFGFMIVPKFIRNSVYDHIARNRYKWFGKKESCMIPTARVKGKIFVNISFQLIVWPSFNVPGESVGRWIPKKIAVFVSSSLEL